MIRLKTITFLAFLLTFNMLAQDNGDYVWQNDEWIWVENDSNYNDENDIEYDDEYEEDYFEEEPFWVLNDSLRKQYRSRAFRKDWKADYSDERFDYSHIKTTKKEITRSDWSGFYEFMAILAKIIGYGILLFILFLVIRALLTDSGFTLNFKKSQKPSVVLSNKKEINIDEDWHALALNAKNKGDLKLAVRYYFMAYLKQLNRAEHIVFHPDKSNRDYRYEIGDGVLRNDFDVLSRVFDYCWYGDFEIDQEQFERVEKLFLNHLKS